MCVSKDWLSQLSSPKFIMTHQNTLNQKHFILQSDKSLLNSLPFNFNTHLKHVSKVRLDLPIQSFSYTVCGSCNGLVLLSYLDFVWNLRVLNPTTKESIQIPELGFERLNNLFGFGYDSLTDDYKLVRIYFLTRSRTKFFYVYRLRTKFWTRLMDVPSDDNLILVNNSLLPGVFVNGILHWFAKKLSDDLPVIVAFGLADEKFNEVPIPNLLNHVDMDHDIQLFDLGGKLGIFLCTAGTIWLMNEYGVKESWTKIVLRGFNEHKPVYHYNKVYQFNIFYDKGKLLVTDHYHRLLIYDIQGRHLSETGEILFDEFEITIKGSYVESLVSPKLNWKSLKVHS
ncbi:F-box/kelch-repeat protein At3g06240-like [Rutidosis leptorrhynchoides]|uniref:F-box/kelch-repeat protein At3g06240-like n=1 Tax=Rutidosis leptorrhynchoides TaxID=125765 RepID=UPI003A98E41C